MKKFLLLLMVAMISLPTPALGFEYTYEGQTLKYYVLDEEAKTCEVAYNYVISGNLIIPSVAKYNDNEYSVAEIRSGSFSNCPDLRSVTIPISVNVIHGGVFKDCGNLTELFFNAENCSFPRANRYYDYEVTFPPSLQKVIIGDDVKIINACAFRNCSGLTSVKISNSVTKIGERSFTSCNSLKSVTIPKSVITIGNEAFKDCDSLTELFFNAENCSYCGDDQSYNGKMAFPSTLQKVIFGDSVKIIPDYAFSRCGYLTSVTIPNSVITIGNGAFNRCQSLTELFFNAENCSYCGDSYDNSAFPYSLQNVILGDSVKIIPDYAFCKGNYVTSVTIPNSVITIGNWPFSETLKELFFNAENCTKCCNFGRFLEKVTFGDNVKNLPENAFKGCRNLTEVSVPSIESWLNVNFQNIEANPTYYAKKLLVNGESIRRLTIPEGTKRINAFSFINCEPLVTVTLPSSLESIGNLAFSGCTGLQRCIFPDIETYLGLNYDTAELARPTYGNKSQIYIGSEEYIDPEEINWPSTLTKIPNYAFYGNEKLKTINIPETVTEIGCNAFCECSGLTSMVIPNSVLSIGDEVFKDCTGLTSVTIGNFVTKIGERAFEKCSGITSMIIPNSVTEIPNYAFYHCSGLTSVIIPNSITTIGSGAFSYCSGITSMIIPNSVTVIGDYAFHSCESLTSVTIPNSVTVIGDYAFHSCESLTSVTIPNSVTVIGDYAFHSCESLTSVTIPNSVTVIGDYAFSFCKSLTSVTIPTSVPVIGDDAFYSCEHIQNVNFQSSKLWSQIKFDNKDSNPIRYAYNFSINGSEVKHLDLDIDNCNVSDYAFYNAYNLNTIRVKGDGISSYSFFNCRNVTDICLDVDSIDNQSFANFANLKTIYCMTTEPPVAPDNAFTKYEGVILYVPVGSRTKYENTENCWWRFLDIIETDFAGIDAIFKADYVDNEDPNGVEAIFGYNTDSDIDFSSHLEVYTLDGVRIANSIDNLAPGLYIVRQGNRSRKIAIQ